MRNSRRKFIRNSSLAATSLAFLSATNKKDRLRETAIGCAPETAAALSGSISSVQSGNWSDPKTWGGSVPAVSDSPLINTGHTVVLDVDSTVSGLSVDTGGVLRFSPTNSVMLQSSQNVVIQGRLGMKPNSVSIVHTLRFINIDESRFVGTTMDPTASDVGLWVVGAGKLYLFGASKKSWTNASDSVRKNDTSITVKDATGWQVGDEIAIVPMDQPNFNSTDWDDKTATLIDYFLPKFERRIITSISGNTINFNGGLNYDHLAISSSVTSSVLGSSSRTWTPEVANLTRNVRIEGTKTGTTDAYANFKRAHIFISSTSAQTIKYMQGRYLGPRNYNSGGSRPTLVTGRYALHFHHCDDGSRGSIVEGCSLFDIGSRCYVPHVSHGITIKNCVAFNAIGEAIWYDWQELSHNCLWDGNLMAAIRINGVDRSCLGMLLGQGDGNIARNNVAVYANSGVAHNGGGCYVWEADSEGVWIFENNISHSSITGITVWQNTSNNHTIINYDSFSCYEGISHGAYGNSYTYRYGHHYNSKIFNEATSGNTSGVVFQDLFIDAAGQDYCATVVDSPIPSDLKCTNKFINCVFKNFKKSAVELASLMEDSNVEKQNKIVDIICCDVDSSKGSMYLFNHKDTYPLKNNCQIRVQALSGQSFQTFRTNSQDVYSNISTFAPTVYGSGMGLTGNYYNGTAFNDFAFSRIDSMIMFQQWSYDKQASPTGVHYLITGDQYSMRWTGYVEAQYSETYTFYAQGGGGFHLWVNNQLIIDSWYDRADAAEIVTSKTLDLVAGKKYNIKLEHYNAGGSRGCMLHWKCPSLPVMSLIPQCQLYDNDASTTGRMAPADVMTVSAGDDKILTLPTNKTNVKAVVSGETDSATLVYQWSKISGPATYTIADPAKFTTNIKDLTAGVYIFRVQVKDADGNTANDDVKITVQQSNTADSMSSESALSVTASSNPSPSSFLLKVSSNSKSPITLTIYNQFGKQVFIRRNLANYSTVTVGDNFDRGTYYAVAEQDGKKQTINLLKL